MARSSAAGPQISLPYRTLLGGQRQRSHTETMSTLSTGAPFSAADSSWDRDGHQPVAEHRTAGESTLVVRVVSAQLSSIGPGTAPVTAAAWQADPSSVTAMVGEVKASIVTAGAGQAKPSSRLT